jgi:multidrug efflux pump subunit AcrA (membrane-fusion protein)
LRVVVNVPESRIESLRAHRRARVVFPDGRSVDSQTLTIFPYAEPDTHTVRVRVNLPEGERAIYPGMLVKVAFVTGRREKLLVPQTAVTERSEVTGVYVQTDAGLEFRQVRTGEPMPDGRVPVLAGLSEGESVVTDPVQAAVRFKSGPEIVTTGGTEL